MRVKMILGNMLCAALRLSWSLQKEGRMRSFPPENDRMHMHSSQRESDTQHLLCADSCPAHWGTEVERHRHRPFADSGVIKLQANRSSQRHNLSSTTEEYDMLLMYRSSGKQGCQGRECASSKNLMKGWLVID